ncbi:MAG: hypothetical protein JKY09_01615, partial [Crocinitomicaceae bacterium]|nr:hypothetical protein [Crocinitomicaceae bacterium]
MILVKPLDTTLMMISYVKLLLLLIVSPTLLPMMTVPFVMMDTSEPVPQFVLKLLPLDVKNTVAAPMSVLNVPLDLIYNLPQFVLSAPLPSPLMENVLMEKDVILLVEMMVMMVMMVTM